jgi:putative phosphoesterase
VKLGLISDVHGHRAALESAFAHLTAFRVDRIVCAGDLVGYGPDPDAVVAFLAERSIASVRGNHDRWALQRGPGGRDSFGGGTPSAETLEYLARLPFSLEIPDMERIAVVFHGSPRSDMEFIERGTHPGPVLRGILTSLTADLLVVGHTHEPMWYRCALGLVVNPGSVISIPVTKTSRTFAVADLSVLSVTFHDLESGSPVSVPAWSEE